MRAPCVKVGSYTEAALNEEAPREGGAIPVERVRKPYLGRAEAVPGVVGGSLARRRAGASVWRPSASRPPGISRRGLVAGVYFFGGTGLPPGRTCGGGKRSLRICRARMAA